MAPNFSVLQPYGLKILLGDFFDIFTLGVAGTCEERSVPAFFYGHGAAALFALFVGYFFLDNLDSAVVFAGEVLGVLAFRVTGAREELASASHANEHWFFALFANKIGGLRRLFRDFYSHRLLALGESRA